MHARALAAMLPLLNDKAFLVPHRMIPMPTTADFEGSPHMAAALKELQDHPTKDARPAAEGFSRLVDLLNVNDAKRPKEVFQ